MIDIESAADEIGISTEAYRRLCRLFLQSTDTDFENLRNALASDTFNREERDKVHAAAHHIKGAAANLDFMELSLLAEKLQLASSEENVKQLIEQTDNLFEKYKTIRDEIEAQT